MHDVVVAFAAESNDIEALENKDVYVILRVVPGKFTLEAKSSVQGVTVRQMSQYSAQRQRRVGRRNVAVSSR